MGEKLHVGTVKGEELVFSKNGSVEMVRTVLLEVYYNHNKDIFEVVRDMKVIATVSDLDKLKAELYKINIDLDEVDMMNLPKTELIEGSKAEKKRKYLERYAGRTRVKTDGDDTITITVNKLSDGVWEEIETCHHKGDGSVVVVKRMYFIVNKDGKEAIRELWDTDHAILF